MKSICLKYKIAILLLFLAYLVKAQDTITYPWKPTWISELHLGTSLPTGALLKNFGSPHFNFGFNLMRQLKEDSPLFIGGALDVTLLDNFKSEVERDFFGRIELWDGSTTVYLIGMKSMTRFFIDRSFLGFEPFLQMNLGAHWTSAGTTLTFPDTDGESDSDFHAGGIALSYGGGIGLLYQINGSWYANITAEYNQGNSSKVYTQVDNLRDPLQSTFEAFEPKKSTTHHTLLNIGITVLF